jgi:anti-sigma B factor antagonist
LDDERRPEGNGLIIIKVWIIMKIEEEIKDKTAILSISVKMLGDTETPRLHEKVKDLITRDIKNIVLDLDNVKLINSIGIGIIMTCWSSVQKVGGQLKLTNAAEKVYDILTIMELDQFFENYQNIAAAVTSFNNKAT